MTKVQKVVIHRSWQLGTGRGTGGTSGTQDARNRKNTRLLHHFIERSVKYVYGHLNQCVCNKRELNNIWSNSTV